MDGLSQTLPIFPSTKPASERGPKSINENETQSCRRPVPSRRIPVSHPFKVPDQPSLKVKASNLKGARDVLSMSQTSLTPCPSSSSSTTSLTTAFSEDGIRELLEWLDEVPMSRPRKQIHRDFSDGVLMAELISHYFPKMIEPHNYVRANGVTLKRNNWSLLNRKVLPKLGIKLQELTIESICLAKAGYIEPVLGQIRKLITKKSEQDEIARAQELAGSSGDANGTMGLLLREDTCLVHMLPNDHPEFVIYQGLRFLPEERVKKMRQTDLDLKEKVKDLTGKVRRQETLLNLKENHLVDLTQQLHELRLKLGEGH